MSAAVLDTTALLAHYRGEPGAEKVQAVLEDGDRDVYLSALSVAEFARRLVALGAAPADARTAALDYAGLAKETVAVDVAVAVRAFELGGSGAGRLPLADALIAATASILQAVLVHRDAHFDAVPPALLRTEKL